MKRSAPTSAEAELSEHQRHILEEVRRAESSLAGRCVLVVDDDVRNIFALSSVLEQRKLQVLHADNGKAESSSSKRRPMWTPFSWIS